MPLNLQPLSSIIIDPFVRIMHYLFQNPAFQNADLRICTAG